MARQSGPGIRPDTAGLAGRLWKRCRDADALLWELCAAVGLPLRPDLLRRIAEVADACHGVCAALDPRQEHLPLEVGEVDLDRLRGLVDAVLGLWYLAEDIRLEAAGDPLAPAPGAAGLHGSWLDQHTLRLWLPEYPPRYPMSFSGRRSVEAFARGSRRWAALVAGAADLAGGRRPRWAHAVIELTFHVPRGCPPDPDSYTVRFVTNGLVTAAILAGDGPQQVEHVWRVRSTTEGAMGTEAVVSALDRGRAPDRGAAQRLV